MSDNSVPDNEIQIKNELPCYCLNTLPMPKNWDQVEKLKSLKNKLQQKIASVAKKEKEGFSKQNEGTVDKDSSVRPELDTESLHEGCDFLPEVNQDRAQHDRHKKRKSKFEIFSGNTDRQTVDRHDSVRPEIDTEKLHVGSDFLPVLNLNIAQHDHQKKDSKVGIFSENTDRESKMESLSPTNLKVKRNQPVVKQKVIPKTRLEKSGSEMSEIPDTDIDKRLQLAKLKMLYYSKKMLLNKHKLIKKQWALEMQKYGLSRTLGSELLAEKTYLIKSPKSVSTTTMKETSKPHQEKLTNDFNIAKVFPVNKEENLTGTIARITSDNDKNNYAMKDKVQLQSKTGEHLSLKTDMNPSEFHNGLTVEQDLRIGFTKTSSKNFSSSVSVKSKGITAPRNMKTVIESADTGVQTEDQFKPKILENKPCPAENWPKNSNFIPGTLDHVTVTKILNKANDTIASVSATVQRKECVEAGTLKINRYTPQNSNIIIPENRSSKKAHFQRAFTASSFQSKADAESEKFKINLNTPQYSNIISPENCQQTENRTLKNIHFHRAFTTSAFQSKSDAESESLNAKLTTVDQCPKSLNAKSHSFPSAAVEANKTSLKSLHLQDCLPFSAINQFQTGKLSQTKLKNSCQDNMVSEAHLLVRNNGFLSVCATTAGVSPPSISIPLLDTEVTASSFSPPLTRTVFGTFPQALQNTTLAYSAAVTSSSQSLTVPKTNVVTTAITQPVLNFMPAVYPWVPIITVQSTTVPVSGLNYTGARNSVNMYLSTGITLKTPSVFGSDVSKTKSYTSLSSAVDPLSVEPLVTNSKYGHEIFQNVGGSLTRPILKVYRPEQFSNSELKNKQNETAHQSQVICGHLTTTGNEMNKHQNYVNAVASSCGNDKKLKGKVSVDKKKIKPSITTAKHDSLKSTVLSNLSGSPQIASENNSVPISTFQISREVFSSASIKGTASTNPEKEENLPCLSPFNFSKKCREIQELDTVQKDKKCRSHKPKDRKVLRTSKGGKLRKTVQSLPLQTLIPTTTTEHYPCQIGNFGQNIQISVSKAASKVKNSLENNRETFDNRTSILQTEKSCNTVPADDESNLELFEQFKIKPFRSSYDVSRYLSYPDEMTNNLKEALDINPRIENYYSLSSVSLNNSQSAQIDNSQSVLDSKNVTQENNRFENFTVESGRLKDQVNQIQVPLASSSSSKSSQGLYEQDLIEYLHSTSNEKTKMILLNGNVCDRWEKLKNDIGAIAMSDPEFLLHLLSSVEKNQKKTTEKKDVGSQTLDISGKIRFQKYLAHLGQRLQGGL